MKKKIAVVLSAIAALAAAYALFITWLSHKFGDRDLSEDAYDIYDYYGLW